MVTLSPLCLSRGKKKAQQERWYRVLILEIWMLISIFFPFLFFFSVVKNFPPFPAPPDKTPDFIDSIRNMKVLW